MKRGIVAAVAMTAAGIAGGFAVPSSARIVTAEPLGAVTTITATTSGSASLVLYDDATVSAAPTNNPDVTISGKGRLIGFDLTSTTGTPDQNLDELTAVRLPAFAGQRTVVTGMYNTTRTCTGYPDQSLPIQQECSGCTYTPSPQVPVQEDCPYVAPKHYVLHEGYYQMSVLTDGAPVQITLRLHGLAKHRAKVHLQSTFRSLETSLTERESLGSTTVTYGGSTTMPNVNGIFTVVGAKLHPNATLVADSQCWRSDTSAPPPYAYSPACPGGHTVAYSYRVMAPGGGYGAEGVGVWAGSLTPSGTPNGIGGSFTDSDGPTFLGGVAVWTDRTDLPFASMLQAP